MSTVGLNLIKVNTQLNPIGIVHSILKKPDDCPLQEYEDAPEATLELFHEFAKAAKDLRPGDRIIVFTWLHQADRSTLTTLPRNNPRAPLTGVFSTRSPDRPNPIGIHFTEVLAVNGNHIQVAELEVLDQTPVIDIKPDLNG